MRLGERLESALCDPRFFRVFAVVTVIIYLLSAGAEALTKCPWWDEGSLGRPAYNLAFNGFLGDPLTDSIRNFRGPLPPALGEYTYWMPPLYFLALAGWFKVFGFSLIVARSLSMAWGLVLLGSWYSIVKSLTAHRRVALLCAALIAADYSVPISCTNVRADAMTAALGCAALALYLRLRERNLSQAVVAGAALAAAAVLTHPLGLIWVSALAGVGLYLDFRRFRAVHLLLSLAPFLVGAAGWGLYILRAPSVFAAQFSANAGYRAAAVTSPFATLAAEVTQRYLQYYFWSANVFALARLKILILVIYFGALLLVMMTPAARRLRGAKMLILIALVALVALGVLDNKKLPGYFVHVLPPLASMVAMAAWWLWSATRVPKPLIALGVIGFMALQLVGLANRVVRNPYQNVYLPVVRFVAANATSSTLVSGPAQLFYGLPPEIRVVDDLTLGYRSGVEPDLIVGDEFYAEPLPGKVQRRPWQRRVQKLLSEKFRLAFSRGAWRVYLRR